jgi:hypothetical protein
VGLSKHGSWGGAPALGGTVPNGHAINTSTVGTKAFTVTATDRTGQHVTKTVHYTVK